MDILLVEDNSIARWVMQNNLRLIGCRVDVAENGEEALKLYHRGYDLIMLDVGLPLIDGLEVARTIRLKETKRNIIVGITATVDETKEACLRAGFNEVYKKPITMDDLITITDRWSPDYKIRAYL